MVVYLVSLLLMAVNLHVVCIVVLCICLSVLRLDDVNIIRKSYLDYSASNLFDFVGYGTKNLSSRQAGY